MGHHRVRTRAQRTHAAQEHDKTHERTSASVEIIRMCHGETEGSATERGRGYREGGVASMSTAVHMPEQLQLRLESLEGVCAVGVHFLHDGARVHCRFSRQTVPCTHVRRA